MGPLRSSAAYAHSGARKTSDARIPGSVACGDADTRRAYAGSRRAYPDTRRAYAGSRRAACCSSTSKSS